MKEALSKHWLERAAAESSVAIGFDKLLPRLRAIGAAPVVLELTEKAIDDETRHARGCVELASSYAGRALEAPPPRATELPVFRTEDEALECALIVLGTCCINESIACEWLRASWLAATDPASKDANRLHLKDEIDHARLGWAYFATLDPARKRHIAEHWLDRMIAVNVAEWKKADKHLPADGIAELGHLAQTISERVIDEAVASVVRPGFAHVGLH
jgi:hypothetical protein